MNPAAAVIEHTVTLFCDTKWGKKSPHGMAVKLAEECGEVCGAVTKMEEGRASKEDLLDELGDVLVVLCQFAHSECTTLQALLERRFNAMLEADAPAKQKELMHLTVNITHTDDGVAVVVRNAADSKIIETVRAKHEVDAMNEVRHRLTHRGINFVLPKGIRGTF